MTVAVAALVAATVVTAVGALQEGAANSAAAKRAAAIDERNAIIARQDAAQDIQTADIAAQDKARENRRRLATIRAAYGSSGIEMAGTPLDVLTDTSEELALDVRRTSYEGQVKAREGYTRVMGLTESAQDNRTAASNARTSSYFKAGSALLSGGSKAAAANAGD